jgi:uncharacterized damage-inducible protein DinB
VTELERIADQSQRGYDGEAWHGTPLRKLVAGLSWQQAAARPVASGHTIWELLLHIQTWRDVVCRRIGGEVVPQSLPPAEDWRSMPAANEGSWREAIASLDESQARVLAAMRTLTDARLHDTVPGVPYTYYVMLHGLVQHDLYHAGQIALLRRQLLA